MSNATMTRDELVRALADLENAELAKLHEKAQQAQATLASIQAEIAALTGVTGKGKGRHGRKRIPGQSIADLIVRAVGEITGAGSSPKAGDIHARIQTFGRAVDKGSVYATLTALVKDGRIVRTAAQGRGDAYKLPVQPVIVEPAPAVQASNGNSDSKPAKHQGKGKKK